MTKKTRKAWRKKNFKLVYFGTSEKSMTKANDDFWRTADIESKFQAIKDFVHDELKKQGLLEHGPKFLRLTSTLRRP